MAIDLELMLQNLSIGEGGFAYTGSFRRPRESYSPLNTSSPTTSRKGSVSDATECMRGKVADGPGASRDDTAVSGLKFLKSINLDGSTKTWTKDAIKQPLTDSAEKNFKKEAVALFKVVQCYMGDRKSKLSPNQVSVLSKYVAG